MIEWLIIKFILAAFVLVMVLNYAGFIPGLSGSSRP